MRIPSLRGMSTRLCATIALSFLGAALSAAEAGVAELRRALPDVHVAGDGAAPRMIYRPGGFLSGPDGFLGGPGASGKAQPVAGDADLARDPHRSVRRFLDTYPAIYGAGSQLDTAEIAKDAVSPRSGMRTTVWQQKIAGIPVLGATLVAHTTNNGSLVTVGGRFLPDLVQVAARNQKRTGAAAAPQVDAAAALKRALKAIGTPDLERKQVSSSLSPGPEQRQKLGMPGVHDTQAELIWFQGDDGLHLAWRIRYELDHGFAYGSVVDADNGDVLEHRQITIVCGDCNAPANADPHVAHVAHVPARAVAQKQSAATPLATKAAQISAAPFNTVQMRVFTGESPKPMMPGLASPNPYYEPPTVPSQLITIAPDPLASPNGWCNASASTMGNNADANVDHNFDRLADRRAAGTIGGGGSTLTFDFTPDLTVAPQSTTANQDAATVNMFYWMNIAHDRLYKHGFTEAFGNYQSENFSRGGLGGDPMIGTVQTALGRISNNASFTDANSDGVSARIIMFLFNQVTPERDSGLDAQLIIHEYMHGLIMRMINGGGVHYGGTYWPQGRSMAEGYCDFMGICLTADPNDDTSANYPFCAYLTRQTSPDNYYRGYRQYPYSTNMSADPMTLSMVPLFPGQEVHGMGVLWGSVLWDARAALIDKTDGTTGTNMILDLVLEAIKLTPPEPTLLEARDALLLADVVLN
nr:M36 family metallopeptidase [Planctomycetota bacterium]